MTCHNCGAQIRRADLAQPALFMGRKIPQPSFCDACLRGDQWPGGRADALQRLVEGVADPSETARLEGEYPGPFSGDLAPLSFAGALEDAAANTAENTGRRFEIPRMKP